MVLVRVCNLVYGVTDAKQRSVWGAGHMEAGPHQTCGRGGQGSQRLLRSGGKSRLWKFSRCWRFRWRVLDRVGGSNRATDALECYKVCVRTE